MAYNYNTAIISTSINWIRCYDNMKKIKIACDNLDNENCGSDIDTLKNVVEDMKVVSQILLS